MKPGRKPSPRGNTSLTFRTRAAAVIPASVLLIAACSIGACAPLAARADAGIALTGTLVATQLESLGASVADEIITNPKLVAFRNDIAPGPKEMSVLAFSMQMASCAPTPCARPSPMLFHMPPTI